MSLGGHEKQGGIKGKEGQQNQSSASIQVNAH
jgi:hypothetical protein